MTNASQIIQQHLRETCFETREKYLNYCKNYFRTDKGKKKNIISGWIKIGVLCYDWDTLYDIYLESKNCCYCNKIFINSKDKHLDHSHSVTDRQNVRGVLCRSCNLTDKLRDFPL